MKYDLTSCIVIENNQCYHVGVNEDPKKDFKVEVTIPEALKILQDKMGMNATEFAKRFQIPAATYSQWVAGRREPTLYVVDMLAVSVEKEILLITNQFETMTNKLVFKDTVKKMLVRAKCYFHVDPNSIKVVSAVDDLGERTYYLTMGSIPAAEVQDVKAWLDEPYDYVFEENVDEAIEKCKGDIAEINKEYADIDYVTKHNYWKNRGDNV